MSGRITPTLPLTLVVGAVDAGNLAPLVGGVASLHAAVTAWVPELLLAPLLVPVVDFLLELHALKASAAATPADTRQIALLRMGLHAFLSRDREPVSGPTPPNVVRPNLSHPSTGGTTPKRSRYRIGTVVLGPDRTKVRRSWGCGVPSVHRLARG